MFLVRIRESLYRVFLMRIRKNFVGTLETVSNRDVSVLERVSVPRGSTVVLKSF